MLTSTGSWPTLLPDDTTTPWPVRACWFCGIAFALASVLGTADQTIRLHRLSSHENGLMLIRYSLRGKNVAADGSFRPRWAQVYTWQLPMVFLVGSVVCMILGMFFLTWNAMLEGIRGGKGFDGNAKV